MVNAGETTCVIGREAAGNHKKAVQAVVAAAALNPRADAAVALSVKDRFAAFARDAARRQWVILCQAVGDVAMEPRLNGFCR
jgi:hypothetical protein